MDSSNWLYCGNGCLYEDSVGFCKIPYEDRYSIGVPKDAKCHHNVINCKTYAHGITPDKFIKRTLEEKYGLR